MANNKVKNKAASAIDGSNAGGKACKKAPNDVVLNILKDVDADYFVVSSGDEFANEYVNMENSHLRALTGFDGSNGVAIIGAAKQYFLTDGRYTLQAASQLGDGFEILNMKDISLTALIQSLAVVGSGSDSSGYSNSSSGVVGAPSVAFFSELISAKFAQSFVSLSEVSVKFATCDVLNKHLKTVRNKGDLSKSVKLSDAFCGCSVEEKMQILQNVMQKNALDAVLVSDCSSVSWINNIRGRDVAFSGICNAYCLVFKGKSAPILINDIYSIDKELKMLNGLKVGVDFDTIAYSVLLKINASNVGVINLGNPLLEPKSIKNNAEIEGFKKSHLQDGVALCKLLHWIDKNIKNKFINEELTEISVSDKLEEFRHLDENYIQQSFESISSFDANSAVIHYKPSNKTNATLKLAANDCYGVFLLDAGVHSKHGGTTDMTRTIAIGNVCDDVKKDFTAVLKGFIALHCAVFPVGTVGSALDPIARHNVWKRGLDYQHGTGHGVGFGLSVHEGACGISPRNNAPIKAGMVISNEPGLYRDGKYGIRIENLVYTELCQNLTNNHHDANLDGDLNYNSIKAENKTETEMLRFKLLTCVPIDLNMVHYDSLTNHEKIWLNNYHKYVFNCVSSFLNKEELQWLKIATAEI